MKEFVPFKILQCYHLLFVDKRHCVISKQNKQCMSKHKTYFLESHSLLAPSSLDGALAVARLMQSNHFI